MLKTEVLILLINKTLESFFEFPCFYKFSTGISTFLIVPLIN